ncbi:hypothetical protein BCR36DRAFT_373542 [Piromyces finnis]|uniref:Uncharacterized protein n=1 Tax=Piromyces finnis TaxID=1754191 RepID=A0A1Y1V1Q8_9FUNG|nr:hypothetical protein BCR36DRAFT_373542 [Piromyces finnis]|eukprot:ORX44061.1 hypothetical protein BCR36DRAFT_373542 [Piromyces finnis]
MVEKLQSIRTDTKELVSNLQNQYQEFYKQQDLTNINIDNEFNKLKTSLGDNTTLQVKLQERLKTLEFEAEVNKEEIKLTSSHTSQNETQTKLKELNSPYEDLLYKYEELQKYCKNPKLNKCLSEITNLKKQLSKIKHLRIQDINNEYKLLFQRNSKTKYLFKIENDFNTFQITLKPKNEKCEKIINTLINEFYLMHTQNEHPEYKIILSNISKFRKDTSFIGTSTLDEREGAQYKRINLKIQENHFTHKELEQLYKRIEQLETQQENRGRRSISNDSRRNNSTSSSNSSDSLTRRLFDKVKNSTNRFNECFNNEEEKQDYFKRNKVKNKSQEEFKERLNDLFSRVKPDFSTSSKEEQYYYLS